MNKIYNIVWSNARQDWVVASESAIRHGKPSTTRRVAGAALITSLLATSLQLQADPLPSTLPTGGKVVAGQAGISQSGATLNINQTTGKAAINWNTFSIGANATVNIVQPGKSSVLLNRVIGSDPSQIYGRMNANGQVFLINPNGVLFGKGARVDVGGLVATTLNIKDSDFLSGNYRFSGNGGSVVNQGELLGSYIALLAPEVRNEGVIIARQGTVALAGSTGATLNLVNNQLIDVMVDAADINTLVENKHLIQAEEGTVIMAAQSANHLLGKLVNSGRIEAKGISSDGGKVRLTASSNIEHSGSINVDAGTNGKGGSAIVIANLDNPDSRTDISGTISARGGSESGDGGFVETSASHLKIADSARIDTRATQGKTGQWLLDPTDFTVAAAGGDITGSTLSAALGSTSVTIDTTGGVGSWTGGSETGSGTNGDIFILDNVTWTNSTSSLTLKAFRNIEIDGATITTPFSPPPTFTLNMLFGQKVSGTYTIKNGATISDGVGGAPLLIAPDGSPMDPLALGFDPFGSTADFTSVPTAFVRLDAGQSSTYGDVPSINYTATLMPDGTGGSVLTGTDSVGGTGWETAPGACTIFAPSNCLLPVTDAGTASYVYAGGISDFNYYYIAGDAANWVIDPRTVTLTANKTYDGTTALTGSQVTIGNTVGTQTLTYTGATASDAHVATTSKYISAISLANGSNGGLASNYVLPTLDNTNAPVTITTKTLNVIAPTISGTTTKAFDGLLAASGSSLSGGGVTGFVGSDAGSLDTSAITLAYNNAHVASANTISASGAITLNFTGTASGSGNGTTGNEVAGDTTDYSFSAPSVSSVSGSISAKQLTATASITAAPKTYDGLLGANGSTVSGDLTGEINGDSVALNTSGLSLAFSDKNVATVGKTISASGTVALGALTPGGVGSKDGTTGNEVAGLITDYVLSSQPAIASVSGTINPASLSAVAIGTKVDDGIDTILGSLIRANGVNGEYFTFTGTGLLPDNLVNNNATATGNLADVNGLALDTANGLNGALASNYAAPPAYSAVTDFDITVTSVASSLTPVEIIQRTIAGNQERAKRLVQGNYWDNITETGKKGSGVTQDDRDTVTQAVQKVLKKLCGDNCSVDEDEVAKYLGGITGCSTGFVLSGVSCAPEQKKAAVVTPPTAPAKRDITELLKDASRYLTDETEQLRISASNAYTFFMMTRNYKDLYDDANNAYKASNKVLDLVQSIKDKTVDVNTVDFADVTKKINQALKGAGKTGDMTEQDVRDWLTGSSDSPSPTATPTPGAPQLRNVSDTNRDIKSVVEYFKDAGADNSRMAQYVNRANNVGGAGKTPVTDADVDWVTNYVNGKGKNVTRSEVETWLKSGQVKPTPSASPSAEPSPSPSASPSASPEPSPSASPSASPEPSPTQAQSNPPQPTAYKFDEENRFPQASSAGTPAELESKDGYVARIGIIRESDLQNFNDEVTNAKEAGATDKEIADYKEKMFTASIPGSSACQTPSRCTTREQAEAMRDKLGMPPMSDEQKKQFITSEEAYDRFKPKPSPQPSPSASPSASPEPTPSASPSASPEPSPSASPSASPEPSPSASPSASPSPSPSASPSAEGAAAKVAANKAKLTNNVDALNQAAKDLQARADKLANQIDLAEKRDAAAARLAAARDAARDAALEADRLATVRNALFKGPSNPANKVARDAALEASIHADRLAAARLAAVRDGILPYNDAVAGALATAAGAPTTPEGIAEFKAALADAQNAAKDAKAAAEANRIALGSTDPDLDIDVSNKKSGDDLTAAKDALNKPLPSASPSPSPSPSVSPSAEPSPSANVTGSSQKVVLPPVIVGIVQEVAGVNAEAIMANPAAAAALRAASDDFAARRTDVEGLRVKITELVDAVAGNFNSNGILNQSE